MQRRYASRNENVRNRVVGGQVPPRKRGAPPIRGVRVTTRHGRRWTFYIFLHYGKSEYVRATDERVTKTRRGICSFGGSAAASRGNESVGLGGDVWSERAKRWTGAE